MIRDRGNIKWTAMMLPEHLEELRKWQAEDDLVKRPVLSEWDLMEIQEEIDLALRRKCEVEVQTWRDGVIHKLAGVIDDLDVTGKRIRVADGWVDVSEVVAVKSLE